MPAVAEIRLLTGSDITLLTDAVKEAVNQLAGDIDRATDVHEFYGEEYSIDDLVVAAATIPLFSSHRVVVGRNLNQFNSDDLAPLVKYLQQPTDTTRLVLEWGSGRVSKALDDAVKAAGGKKISAAAPSGAKRRRDWLSDKLKETGIDLDQQTRELVLTHLGNEISRLGGLLATLESVFGAGAKLSVQDVTPYLGMAGDVPPWDLTDAIDKGDIAQALSVLQRLWQASVDPIQISGSLNFHYARIMKLEGADVQNEKQAAQVLGQDPGKSTFMAGKALKNARRMGHARVKRAVELLANADADLKGVSGLDNRCVLEILVGRLAAANRS